MKIFIIKSVGIKSTDVETGLYYCNSRYYVPEWGRWLNADDISYLDPSSVNGLNLFAYCNNNPVMYTDSTGCSPNWHMFSNIWEATKIIGRFLGGLAITAVAGTATIITAPLALIPGLAVVPQSFLNMTVYGGALMASSWDTTIRDDLRLISYNPFNTNETATLQSQKVSFYKGTSVIRFSPKFMSSFSFGLIFLERGVGEKTLKHEWGHTVQLSLLGVLGYSALVAVPSVIVNLLARKYKWFDDNYYKFPWESTADWFGGVRR